MLKFGSEEKDSEEQGKFWGSGMPSFPWEASILKKYEGLCSEPWDNRKA